VKSVLGEFSSGVSICHNKSTQSDLGSLPAQGPPGRGNGRTFLRLCSYDSGDEQKRYKESSR